MQIMIMIQLTDQSLADTSQIKDIIGEKKQAAMGHWDAP